MSIDFIFWSLQDPWIIPCAVVLSVRVGVAGWGCPSSSRVFHIGIASWAFKNSPPSSASAADETTFFMILTRQWTWPLYGAFFLFSELKKKWPPARDLAHAAVR